MDREEFFKTSKYKPVRLLQGVDEIINDFEERLETGDVKYGKEILDDCVSSVRKGSVTAIVAKPNTGKSLWSQLIATHWARCGKKVLLCSCEMGAGLLMERQLRQLMNVTPREMFYMYKRDRQRAEDLMYSVYGDKYDYLENIYVMETGGATIDDMIEVFDVFKEFEYIIIDYIQRVRGTGTDYEIISNAFAKIQAYARATKKRFIVCSQGKRTEKKVQDLENAGAMGKGSGSIEEDADVGLLLSEVMEKGTKKILATLFKNRFEESKNITYKYRFDGRGEMILEDKNYVQSTS